MMGCETKRICQPHLALQGSWQSLVYLLDKIAASSPLAADPHGGSCIKLALLLFCALLICFLQSAIYFITFVHF